MTRATRAVIDLPALRHNLSCVRRHAPASQVLAIVKANAYGHGSIAVARTLASDRSAADRGADAFGVATLDEAITLREAGIERPVVLLEGVSRAADLNLVRGYRLQLVVHCPEQLDMLERSPGSPIPVWLKIDTGMNRLGIAPQQAAGFYQRLRDCPAVAQVRLMTHLACADLREDPMTPRQLERFARASEGIEAQCSIANSAGILAWSDSHRDWVRPGIMLYGVSPFATQTGADLGLRPAMRLHAELIGVKQVSAGETVGYGASWRCPETMPVGVVAIGYGDGYPRHAPSGTPVRIGQVEVPLIGRVSMDMITVDLRPQPAARIGDAVELWGPELPVETIARAAGTIGYELLCKLTSRVDYRYQGSAMDQAASA